MQHEVIDFAKWKIGFDADEPNRAKAGIKLKGLYTSVKNPNEVTMIFEAPGTDVLEAFTNDPRLHEAMKEAGVISEPKISVLKEA